MDGHNKNSDHKALKEPFSPYEKGENSKQKTNSKVNHTYTYDDDVINMVELVDFEHCDVITIKGKHDNTKPKTPFVLRGATSLTTDQQQ